MRRSKIHAALLLAVGSGTAIGCASIFGLDELTLAAPGQPEAGSEAGTDAGTVADSSATPEGGVNCTTPGYPARPTSDSPNLDGGDLSIRVALSQLDFGLGGTDDGGFASTSFNLDGICTVNAKTSSCVTKASGTDFGTYVVDKSATGVDNAGASLIQFISMQGPVFTPQAISARLRSGGFGGVIYITGYNGHADDTTVGAFFFPSFGISVDGGVTFGPTDLWRVDKGDLGASETSMWGDTNAWVAGGKLVAHVPRLPLRLTVDPTNPLLTLMFDDALLTADIVKDGTGTFRLTNGVLAGRVATQPFLDSINQLYYAPNGANDFICNNDTFKAFITATICNARDIMSSSLNDNTGMPCDAFSAGAGFDTYAVNKQQSGDAPSPLDSGCPVTPDCK